MHVLHASSVGISAILSQQPKQTDLIYLDFSKAFDSVDHQILLRKLQSYGVAGRLLHWFCDYLSRRTQRVVIEGVPSSWSSVVFGVQQRVSWVHYYLLFSSTIFQKPYPMVLQLYYADDTKLYGTICSSTDSECLQESLSNFNTWTHENNIKFKASKCKILSVTRKKNPITFN